MIPWVHYFYVKTKMSADFQICISVPLKLKNNFEKVNLNNSNPLVHLHIQSYSLTNSVLKFRNLRQYWDLNFQTTTLQNTCQWLPHLLPIYRSSPSQMLFIIGFLKSFTIFLGKYLCWNLFLIKFIKKRLQHRCFPANIANF